MLKHRPKKGSLQQGRTSPTVVRVFFYRLSQNSSSYAQVGGVLLGFQFWPTRPTHRVLLPNRLGQRCARRMVVSLGSPCVCPRQKHWVTVPWATAHGTAMGYPGLQRRRARTQGSKDWVSIRCASEGVVGNGASDVCAWARVLPFLRLLGHPLSSMLRCRRQRSTWLGATFSGPMHGG